LSGPLAGKWRYRVGDIRIIVRFEDHIMVILMVSIGNRREVYR
jgi:mRNA interferase RelE/StbE